MRRWMLLLVAPSLLLIGAGRQEPPPFPPSIVAWTPSPKNPVFKGEGADAWDKKIRERGWIMVEGGIYHLWYTGYNDAREPDRLLGHATSNDGLTWVRDPANPLRTGSWVEDVCILKHDGTYFMVAEGKGDIAHMLTSKDGVKWDEQGPLDIRKADGTPIDAGPRGTPTLYLDGDLWNLFYERYDQGVWLARSKDRKVWTNVQDEPVLKMGPESYDKTAVAMNQVVKRDGVYYGIYHANAERPWKEWTTCVARSKDLIHWEKYAGNPIAVNNSSSGILVDTEEGPRLYTMHPEVRVYEPK